MHLNHRDSGLIPLILQFVFDPVHYKNNLLKLYNIGVRMKPTRSLPMYYDDINDTALEPYDHASDVEDGPQQNDDYESYTMQADAPVPSDAAQQKLSKVSIRSRLKFSLMHVLTITHYRRK
jgi:hypothetical protein